MITKEKFILESIYQVSGPDAKYEYIEIGPDADTGALIEICVIENPSKKITRRISLPRESVELVCIALQKCAEDLKIQ